MPSRNEKESTRKMSVILPDRARAVSYTKKGIKKSTLLPEHLNRTSRQNLLVVWTVLDWLGNNKIDSLLEAAKALGLTAKELQAAVVELGGEVTLWK